MAPVQPAGFLENRQDHTAGTIRLALAGLAAGGAAQGATSPAGGVHPTFGGRLNVTGTTDMHVSIDTGLVYMPATTAWGGVYAGYNNGAYVIGPLAASSATQFRSDLICARQHDSQNGDPDDNWDIVPVTGTFSATSPAPIPAAPNNAVPLAVVNVTPNMAATNGAGTISDIRQYMPLPGPIYTTSTNKPSVNAPEGTMWFETDLNRLGIIISNARSYVAVAPDDGWFPPITATKPADTGRSTTTMTNDPDLQLTLRANCVYRIEGIIIYDGGTGASEGDIQYTWNKPSGSSLFLSTGRLNLSGAFAGGFLSVGTDIVTAQTLGVGTYLTINVLAVYYSGNTAGTLAFQWGQNTQKVTQTHVKANSFLTATRIA